jgi:peptidoglycan hydrolase-like protein with peptidoglycan-binding domain
MNTAPVRAVHWHMSSNASFLKTARYAAIGCLLLLGSPGLLRADELLRKIQQSLRDQGFYYGPIDGTPGDETTQAIRRYQIRNGLAVTGVLNDETTRAIEHSGADAKLAAATSKSSSAAASQETPPPLEREPEPAAPAPRPRANVEEDAAPAPAQAPAPPRPPGPPPRGAVETSAALSDYFASTPYEFAPPPIQTDVLRRAQVMLLHDGFFGGNADGVPGIETSDALTNYQQVNHLPVTGKLDTPTLATLRLLPRRAGPRNPAVIYEGRIVH